MQRDRDADAVVHRRVGRSMKLIELAEPMITRSSNLATNLLFEFLTPEFVQATLAAAEIDGVRVVRGVEDNVAFERGLNNTLTAAGLVGLFRLLRDDRLFPEPARRQMLDILFAQEFQQHDPGSPACVRAGRAQDGRDFHLHPTMPGSSCCRAGAPTRSRFSPSIHRDSTTPRRPWRRPRGWSTNSSPHESRRRTYPLRRASGAVAARRNARNRRA
ncbi:MAG: serine hydrolase [Chthoniobacter sp.]